MGLCIITKSGTLNEKEASYVNFMLHKDNEEYTLLSPMEDKGKPVCLEMNNGYALTMIRGLECEIERNTRLEEVVVHTNLNVYVLQRLPVYIRLKELADKNKVKLIIEFDDFMLDVVEAAKLGWDNVCIRRTRYCLSELASLAKRCSPCYVRLRKSEYGENDQTALRTLRTISGVLVDT